MTLRSAEIGKEYIIKSVNINDDETEGFLFSLGCYSGQPITVVAQKKSLLFVSIKDARYTIDFDLADTIEV